MIRQAGGGDVTREFGDNRFQGFATFQTDGNFDEPWTGTAQLLNSPWKEADPLADLRQYNLQDDAQNHVAEAFQIRDAWPVLRTAADDALPVGVKTLGAVDYVKQMGDAQQHRRIVEPGKQDSAHGVYGSLDEALLAADPGDKILLRWDGPQDVEPIRLDKDREADVTIRPEDYRHPQLVLHASPETETAMFRVYNGSSAPGGAGLRAAGRPSSTRQSVIDLVGQGQCYLRNCVVTLDRSARPGATRLAAVWMSDPKVMMKTMQPASQTPPLLSLDGCFVRGDGDLVVCPTSRQLTLEATNTLAGAERLLPERRGRGGRRPAPPTRSRSR